MRRAHNLNIRRLVNGEVHQSSSTQHFMFNCYAMVEQLSKAITLEAGDMIFTGTPSGARAMRKPPSWLKQGDHARVEI